jgi:hypothetical protein
MTTRDEKQAEAHPAYKDALRRAIGRAAGGKETAVYWDGTAVYVRDAYAPKPADAATVCIAQRWDDKTVQLRFSGARSEWVKI